jgi:GPH family glycoside/pentoside/hexuronide:cation symporter
VLTPLQRIGYGIGGAVFSVKEAAYAVFVLIFYTQVMGLGGSAAGIVLFLAVVFDSISDPVIGAWSDRLQTRWGRRHPFMLGAIFPLGLGFIGLFTVPEPVRSDQWLLAGWLLFWTIWIRTLVSCFTIPHLALSAEITRDYHERSRLIGIRMFFVFLTTVLVPALTLPLLFAESGGEDGRFVQANYPVYGLISCVLMWLVGLACVFGTRRHVRPRAGDNQHPGLALFLRDFLRTLHNRNFRNLILFEILAMISYGVLIALNIIVWTYYWELGADEMSGLLAAPSVLGVCTALPIMTWLGRRWPKHRIMQVAGALMCFNISWVLLLRFWGWLPENGHPLVFQMLLVQMVLWMFLFILRTISVYSLIADITDEHELEQGQRQEGAFFAAFAFASKLASGIGPLFGGIVLDFIGLERGMLPGTIDQGPLDALALATLLGILLPLLLSWHFSLRVSLSEERLKAIQTGLAQRS